MPLRLILLAMALAATSGLAGLPSRRSSARSQRIAAALMVLAALLGLGGAGLALLAPAPSILTLPWPAVGNSLLGIDPLSAFFLLPIFLMGGLGAIYGLGYWSQSEHPGNARKLQVFWGFLVAGLALLAIARHALAFLLGWEAMALSAFFLIGTEDHRGECRRAALVYLVAAHLGTLVLFGLFALWRRATGSFALVPAASGALGLGAMNLLFVLALLAFGLKAGMMPLHFWLPGAHANSPSHVSAMLSGVVLKMGIYGLLRILSLMPDPPLAWGLVVLALGAISGLLGVAYAVGQHDLKRLLAYHSVENIGIILMGMGLALLGSSLDRPALLALGMGGCLLHVWNHSLFKSLLFLGAGSVLRATGTRRIDLLGGLAKSMPWTAALFLVGAVAICGLPPLNGFVSELLIYLGIFEALGSGGAIGAASALAAPVLAMIGALALACFVKVQGTVFSGNPRSAEAIGASESPVSMRLPMIVLAAACLFIGLAPFLVAPLLDRAIASWASASDLPSLGIGGPAPLAAVGAASAALLGAVAALTILSPGLRRARRGLPTWDCGYARPTARMQYSASSFARGIVSMFAWVLRPREAEPRVQGRFPGPSSMRSEIADTVLDGFLLPAFGQVEVLSVWFRRFQKGHIQQYMLYILVAVVLLLATLLPYGELLALLAGR